MNTAIAIAAVSGLAAAAAGQTINISITKTQADIGEDVNVIVTWTGAPLAQYDIMIEADPSIVERIVNVVVLGGDNDDFYNSNTFGNLGQNTVNNTIGGPGITNTNSTLNIGQTVDPFNAASTDLTDSTGNPAADLAPAFVPLVDGLGNVDGNPAALFSFTFSAQQAGTLTFNAREGERAVEGIATFQSSFDAVFGSAAFTAYDNVTVNSDTIEIVPAPSSLALLGLGGLAAARRRR